MKIMNLNTFKKTSSVSIKMIGLNALFSLFYWIMESVRDVIIFNKGSILERIFRPDAMSFWMRMLVISIFILFSIYSNSLREKIEVKKVKVSRSVEAYGIIWTGVAFAVVYWFLEAFRDVFVFEKGNLFERLILPDAMGFWMRILVVFILILFSVYIQNLINQRRRIEDGLRNEQEILEKLMGERTSELLVANDQLVQQIGEREKAEADLRRANRALLALSACDEIMIRAGEESNLLRKICQTLADMGGYPLVWVSYIERNGSAIIRPAAQCGSLSGDSELIRLTTEDHNDDKNPVGQAVRSGNASMVKYLSVNGNTCKSWAAEAVARGYASLLSLPLKSDGEAFGALSMFAEESDAFDMKELDLMEKLAGNLAFGIMAARTRNQRDRAEDEKEKMQAQLLQSHKMEAIGILAGGVAHDFNNLLTAIQVSADLAMMEVGETNSVYKTLKEIHLVSTHAADLARQLLLFSRKHPMEYVTLNLNGTIQNLHKMLKRLIGEDIRIETVTDPDLSLVLADRGTIEQVIMNLAVNARDAMPKGGRLTIETRNVTLDEAAASKMSDARSGRFVCVSVSDTGAGMTKNVLEHIFEPFFSTKGVGKGTGLGLSVVYGIVKQHEGWIHVDSHQDYGSAFHIYLPAVQLESQAETMDETGVTAFLGNGERILMIEDDDRVRQFAEKGLVHSGYKVLQAFTADQARTLFDQKKSEIDLVFSDVVLPDRSGIELFEELIRIKPELKVIFTSGYTDYKSQWPIIKEKGFQYLQKPYGLADLLKMIRMTLDKPGDSVLQRTAIPA